MEAQRKENARRIYEQIMRWLEDGGQSNAPDSGRDFLTIALPATEGAISQIRFRRVKIMLGAHGLPNCYAQSMDMAGIKINYDPNWESLSKIDMLTSLPAPVKANS